ncbi:MAG: hypothetical protein PHQ22_10620 [Sulfuricurvum sp.]|nr:hypothetical protein [Sulfuricurvum sp.]
MKHEININREENVRKAIDKNPELFSSDIREAVLKGEIIIGMTPFQAQLAGGAFAFRVSADPAHWGANADPYRVMEAQTYHPDNSKIRMTFQNNTQFHGEGIQTFHVEFVNGQAYVIEKIQGDIHAK